VDQRGEKWGRVGGYPENLPISGESGAKKIKCLVARVSSEKKPNAGGLHSNWEVCGMGGQKSLNIRKKNFEKMESV